MRIHPQLSLHGLLPQGFRPCFPPAKPRTGPGDAESPSSSEKNSRPNHGSLLGGLWTPKRVGRGMTAQSKGNTIMGGCLNEIARGSETRNYVNEPLLGSTNQHPSSAFLRFPPLQLHTGTVVIMTPLTYPRQPRAWLITCWKGARKHHPGSMDRAPSVPGYKTRGG